MLDGFISPKLHYLRQFFIHFHPNATVHFQAEWFYIDRILICSIQSPSTWEQFNCILLIKKNCFHCTLRCHKSSTISESYNCEPQENLRAPHTSFSFPFFFLHPTPLTVVYTREFQIKSHFKKYCITNKKFFSEQSLL